jgi:hypothetical protein
MILQHFTSKSFLDPWCLWLAPGCLLGASWVPPGCLLGLSWVLLGVSWVSAGCSRVPPWCLPGAFWPKDFKQAAKMDPQCVPKGPKVMKRPIENDTKWRQRRWRNWPFRTVRPLICAPTRSWFLVLQTKTMQSAKKCYKIHPR